VADKAPCAAKGAVHGRRRKCLADLDELSAAVAVLTKENDSEKGRPRCLGLGAVERGGDTARQRALPQVRADKENNADLPRSSWLGAGHGEVSKAACTLPSMQRTQPFARMIRPCPCL
jgi:hypothetical protein